MADTQYSKEFRQMWRKKRRDKEISLSEIARVADCKHNHFSQWELNEEYPVAEEKLQIYFDYIENH